MPVPAAPEQSTRQAPPEAEPAAAEQAAFVELVGGLSPGEMAAESLCHGWSVRDVVVHVAGHVHHEPATGERLRLLLRARLSPDRAGDLFVRSRDDMPVDALVAWLAAPIPLDARHVETDLRVQLGELVIHHQDVRRALGRPRTIDPAVLTVLLDFGLTRFGSLAVAGARKRAMGLSLRATDLEWAVGDGPLVEGPGEAILMALSGRPQALGDLSGSGHRLLADRLAE